MTDTGQVPGEGLPENAGMVEQPGVPAPGDYTFLDPSDPSGNVTESGPEDDDLLLMPAAQGAWSDPQVVPAQQQPVAAGPHFAEAAARLVAAAPQQTVAPYPAETAPRPAETVPQTAEAAPHPSDAVPQPSEAGAHEAGGRDSGSVDFSGVRMPPPQAAAVTTAPPSRRPLHMGPPVPDATGGVVRSLADRGPAAVQSQAPGRGAVPGAMPGAVSGGVPGRQFPPPVPTRHAGPPTVGPEYLDIPRDEAALLPGPQLGEIPSQGPTSWTPQPQRQAASVQVAPAPVPAQGQPQAEAPHAPPEAETHVQSQPQPQPQTQSQAQAPDVDQAPVSDKAPDVDQVPVAGTLPPQAPPHQEAQGDTAETVVPEPVIPEGVAVTAASVPEGVAVTSAAVPEAVSVTAAAVPDALVGTGEAAPAVGVAQAPAPEAIAPEAAAVTPEDVVPDVAVPAASVPEAADPEVVAPTVAAPTTTAPEPVGADPVQHAANEAESLTTAPVFQPGPARATPMDQLSAEAVPSAGQFVQVEGSVPEGSRLAPIPPRPATETAEATDRPSGPVTAQPVPSGPDAEQTAADPQPVPAVDVTVAAEPGPGPEAAATPVSEAGSGHEAVAGAAPGTAVVQEEAREEPAADSVAVASEAPDDVLPEQPATVPGPRDGGPAAQLPPLPEQPAAETETAEVIETAEVPGPYAGPAHQEPAQPRPAREEAAQPAAAAAEPVPDESAPDGPVPDESVPDGPVPDESVPDAPVQNASVPDASVPAALVREVPVPNEPVQAEAPGAVPDVAPEQPAAVSPGAPAASGYDDAEREAVLRVMRERRDIRNGFRSDPVPHEVLLRVLEAAHTAPSVGHSQPWDFVVIRSAETRRAMHELASRQRDAYAKSLPKARAKQFKELKIEAILDTPVNIVVTADPTRGGRHTLGRHTQPQMAPYSSALAVENLWLAARAEGLGVGWVSFFDEREMVRALGLPEHLEVVAYLCVGYVDEFPEEPELLQAGWSKRRPLSWVVHEETYGRRALPGEEPHDLLQETITNIRPLDAKALGEAWERQKRMTKPAGALGMLEIISAQLSGLSRACPPPIPEPAAVAIFAGDHGVHAQGVTAWPQEVTAQMVANFLGGGAVCNAFANQVGAEVCVVDVGVAGELPATPGLLPRKVRAGTGDFTTGPALSREEVLAAIEVGIETARDLVAAGNKALLTGEMGIANTTVSAALICVYTGQDPAEVTGRGTGINDEMHARKVDVVRRALELHQPDPADPIGVLAAVGGLEHAALVGFLLGGASLRTPVILDGVSAGAAALVARAVAPEALAACIAGHRSAEPGHVAALNKLGLRPLVDLDLRLGEGTGALLALPVVQSAARAMHEVATFDSAGVTEK